MMVLILNVIIISSGRRCLMRILDKAAVLMIVALSCVSCGIPQGRAGGMAALEAARGGNAEQRRGAAGFVITAVQLKNGAIRIAFSVDDSLKTGSVTVLRSTAKLPVSPNEEKAVPLVKTAVQMPADCWLDDSAAHGTRYNYQAVLRTAAGKVVESPVVTLETAGAKLRLLRHPTLLVDKRCYTLEVIDDGVCVKRYPVALGRNPVKRKLNQDNSSTPEGVYEIVNVQPQATYYKAYDLSYPNGIDEMRYQYARSRGLIPLQGGEVLSIGGEIQIHGRGIEWNWTFGCVAMRNSDIDELFLQGGIGVGTKVYISGEELSREDMLQQMRGLPSEEIEAARSVLAERGYLKRAGEGEGDESFKYALRDFQRASGLPVTFQLDVRTKARLLGNGRNK